MGRNTRHQGVWFPGLLAALILLWPAYDAASGEDRVTDLGAKLEEVCAAGDGRYLVLKLKDRDALQIYDTGAGAIARTLDVPNELCIFGAGGDRILVFDPTQRELHSYDIETLERINSRELAAGESIVRIVMGYGRGDMAFVRVAFGGDALSQCRGMLVDTKTLRPIQGGEAAPGVATMHNTSFRDVVHLRADRNLRMVTEWATSHTPSGVGLLAVDDLGGIRPFYNHESHGYVAPADDGLVYVESGQIYGSGADGPLQFGRNALSSKGELGPVKPFPALGGTWLLGLKADGSLDLYLASRMKPLGSVGPLPDFPKDWRPRDQEGFQTPRGRSQPQSIDDAMTRTDLTLDRRIYFIPDQKGLVFLPKSNDRIIRRDIDIKQILDAKGDPYLVVLSPPPSIAAAGKPWTHPLRVMAKGPTVEYRLVSGPEGMTVSPDGVLSWNVPGGIEGQARVVVSISDDKGSRTQERFTLKFR